MPTYNHISLNMVISGPFSAPNLSIVTNLSAIKWNSILVVWIQRNGSERKTLARINFFLLQMFQPPILYIITKPQSPWAPLLLLTPVPHRHYYYYLPHFPSTITLSTPLLLITPFPHTIIITTGSTALFPYITPQPPSSPTTITISGPTIPASPTSKSSENANTIIKKN